MDLLFLILTVAVAVYLAVSMLHPERF
ncbi:MAG: potassium-transporting ATPase subunit F [Myxococcales bacterium]|nr:potassium-transporting ATPase subunit F [Myxococcales bacterium]MCB9552283.1 potassium-transporting ATPase subunit F [Myxococcales bacterium]